MDGSEYPKHQIIEDASELNINSISLQKIISSTLFASGNDDLRPVMSGVFSLTHLIHVLWLRMLINLLNILGLI